MATTLDYVPDSAWQIAADRLNDVGVFADEDRQFPTPSAIRRDLPRFDQLVRRHGYIGRPLSVEEIDRPAEGVTFVVFDRTKLGNSQVAQATWSQDYAGRRRRGVQKRVRDWISRLEQLRELMQNWLPAGVTISDRSPIQMHEDLMIQFGVPAAEMPTFDITDGSRRLLRVQPKGLHIIGANGRVDLITPSRSLILVDRSMPTSSVPDWCLYEPHDKGDFTRFDKTNFIDLLK
jgi:hypothetical protein